MALKFRARCQECVLMYQLHELHFSSSVLKQHWLTVSWPNSHLYPYHTAPYLSTNRTTVTVVMAESGHYCAAEVDGHNGRPATAGHVHGLCIRGNLWGKCSWIATAIMLGMTEKGSCYKCHKSRHSQAPFISAFLIRASQSKHFSW